MSLSFELKLKLSRLSKVVSRECWHEPMKEKKMIKVVMTPTKSVATAAAAAAAAPQ